ncbi:MAG: YifB family Mg chelatase-like AAA ATPase [Desulfocapsaceae bacterium]
MVPIQKLSRLCFRANLTITELMLVKVGSAALHGIDGVPVSVEVDVSRGLPSFTTVGLPDSSVRESKDRVRAAIKNCGYEVPSRKITVNLAPADIKKEGPSFDLPIALGLLAATGIISPQMLKGYLAVGELSLDGSLLPVSGALSIAITASEVGYTSVIVPLENGREALLTDSIKIVAVSNLYQIVEILNGVRQAETLNINQDLSVPGRYQVGFEDIKGQTGVKRALAIAAAGMHNIVMEGTPGTGKTMLAKSIPSIMADWTLDERLETTRIYSIIGKEKKFDLLNHRPFRSPHHTISDAGLIGGGTYPRPGEVSLAHNGVLFLDELPEFRKHVLEVLRQPMEDGLVTLSRAQASLTYPSRFMLVAAMNPCPCGYLGDGINRCRCTEQQIRNYKSKISGPLLDRIDMQLVVSGIDFDKADQKSDTETSAQVRSLVSEAMSIQAERFKSIDEIHTNAQMGVREIEKYCQINLDAKRLLTKSVKRLGLSPRAFHKILKVARTIADLNGNEHIDNGHVAEAVQYRRGEVLT